MLDSKIESGLSSPMFNKYEKGEIVMTKCSLLISLLLIAALAFGTFGCKEEEVEEATPTPTAIATEVPTPISTPTPTLAPSVTPEPTLSPTATISIPASLPCRFHGSVELDGSPVADGVEITATINGDPYITTTPSDYGPSTYVILITPPSGTTYADGTIVTFNIGSRIPDQTGIWETGGNIILNLSAD